MAALLALLCVASGCVALPWPEAPLEPVVEPPRSGLLDLRGAVHVHTSDSHDSPGRLEDLLSGAEAAGIAWIALTEHTAPGGPSKSGQLLPPSGAGSGIVVIPGYELRGFGGSLLALGVDELPESYRDPRAVLQQVRAAGGAAFIGHLETSTISERDWKLDPLDGIEIENLHARVREAGVITLLLRGLLLPAPFVLRTLLRTPRANLDRWESLPGADAIVAGVDAHAKVRVLGPLGGTIDSYSRVLRLVTTHVLVPAATREEILAALREGRSYVAYEGLGRVDRFRFERVGDQFEIEAPRVAKLVLTCDGARQEQLDVSLARLPIPRSARRCRAEAWLGPRLWIVTSYQRVAPRAP